MCNPIHIENTVQGAIAQQLEELDHYLGDAHDTLQFQLEIYSSTTLISLTLRNKIIITVPSVSSIFSKLKTLNLFLVR